MKYEIILYLSVTFYNLDVIISVGSRVKFKPGTQFRIWVTNVLRDYLLKGYAPNKRMDGVENTSLRNWLKKYAASALEPWLAFSKTEVGSVNILKQLNMGKI